MAREPAGTAISSLAATVEARQGVASAQRIAYEVAAPLIAQAASWAELHSSLARVGIEYRKKGSGGVIAVGGHVVKATRAGRQASRPSLERRLGPFVAHLGPVASRSRESAPDVAPERLAAFDAARAARAAEVLSATGARSAIQFKPIEGADPTLAPIFALLSAKARRMVDVPRALNDIRSFDVEQASSATAGPSRQSDAPAPATEIDAIAYHRHRERILEDLRKAGRMPNRSRVDGWVAQRLRAHGRDRAAVEATIAAEAKRWQPGVRRDWAAYAWRVAEVGFGPESTAYIAADDPRREAWRRDEEAAEALHWRERRGRAIAELTADLHAVFVQRQMDEHLMRLRHRARVAEICDVKWRLRRLRRAGLVLAVASALIEAAFIDTLLHRERVRHDAEQNALRAAASRAAAEVKESRRVLRAQMRGPSGPSPRQVVGNEPNPRPRKQHRGHRVGGRDV